MTLCKRHTPYGSLLFPDPSDPRPEGGGLFITCRIHPFAFLTYNNIEIFFRLLDEEPGELSRHVL